MRIVFLALAVLSAGVLCVSRCRAEDEPVRGKLIFEDGFDDLSKWVSEGPFAAELRGGRLHVKTVDDARKVGQYVWCRRELPADFRLTFDVTPRSASGFFLLFFCQRGVRGEDILGDDLFRKYLPWKSWKPYEDFDKYVSAPNRAAHHASRIRGYHVSYRRNESANCNFRKNPGLHLLESHKIDAVLPKDKTAHVELTKVGERVTLTVDGKRFMDHLDKQARWSGGRFGFRQVYDSDGGYDNVKLYDLGK